MQFYRWRWKDYHTKGKNYGINFTNNADHPALNTIWINTFVVVDYRCPFHTAKTNLEKQILFQMSHSLKAVRTGNMSLS